MRFVFHNQTLDKNLMKNVFYLIIGALILTSCAGEKNELRTGSNLSTSELYERGYERNDPLSIPYLLEFHGVPATNDLSDQIFGTIGKALLFADTSFSNKNSQESLYPLKWEVEHEKVQKLLSENKDSQISTFLRQECAVGMLMKTDLLSKSEYNDAKMVLSIYTEILVNEGTYSPGLIYHALESLNGHWDNRKISESANRALSRKEKFEKQYDSAISELDAVENKTTFEKDMLVAFRGFKQRNQYYTRKLQKI
jgi:hypothetical protein